MPGSVDTPAASINRASQSFSFDGVYQDTEAAYLGRFTGSATRRG